jgi:prepilin-type N-terminal cleavage/methylation domain-containing protein
MGDGQGRRGFTLIELLVAITIVATLVGVLLPAVQSARESSRATVCRNHLREVALATCQFEVAMGSYPPARIAPGPNDPWWDPTTGPTWVMRVLPWLEEIAPVTSWDPTLPYESQVSTIRELVVPTLLCPSRRTPSSAMLPTQETPPSVAPCGCMIPGMVTVGGGVTDFAGSHGDLTAVSGSIWDNFSDGGNGTGIIISSRYVPGTLRFLDPIRTRDVTDGISRTILIGELHVRRHFLLTAPDCGPALDGSSFHHMSRVGGPGGPIADGPDDEVAGMSTTVFGSWHTSGCHFAFGDGRIVTVSPRLDPTVLGYLCNRRDGHVSDGDPSKD